MNIERRLDSRYTFETPEGIDLTLWPVWPIPRAFANLREEVLDSTLQQPVRNFDRALNYLGASHYLHQRQQAQQLFRQRGVLSLGATPAEQLSGD